MDKVRFFKEICRLTDESLLAQLAAAAQEETFRPREYITKPGDQPKAVWYLAEGVVCFGDTDDDGREQVDMLISRPGLTSNAILFDYNSRFGEKALTKTTILSVPHEKYAELLACCPEMEALRTRQIRLYALKYWKLRMVCANMPLAGRMYWFRRVDPQAFAAVSNAQLASFFGVSRESISRVRTRLKKETEYYDIPGRIGETDAFRKYYEALCRFEDPETEPFDVGKTI